MKLFTIDGGLCSGRLKRKFICPLVLKGFHHSKTPATEKTIIEKKMLLDSKLLTEKKLLGDVKNITSLRQSELSGVFTGQTVSSAPMTRRLETLFLG